MKAVAMVAHPDDCVIFAYSFMYHYSTLDWTVCYLTYTEHDSRGQELKNFWNCRNINTEFLGFVDDWHDIENNTISFDTGQAEQDIIQMIGQYDLVLTHDRNGDYGHLHHKFVHDVCVRFHPNVVTFAGPRHGNACYTVPKHAYSVDELPQHGKIVQDFHPVVHVNEYTVSDYIKKLLEQ